MANLFYSSPSAGPQHQSHVVIEAINSNRTIQTQEAVYLLMSTTANVERIIADFSNGRKQYAGAHVFFMDGMIKPSNEQVYVEDNPYFKFQAWRSRSVSACLLRQQHLTSAN